MATSDVEKLAQLFLDGDHTEAMRFIKQQPNQSRMVLFKDLFTPAMYRIGELWENNEISVADEHLATGVCDFVLSRLFQVSAEKLSKNNKAMFLCLQGEQHYLGLKMINSLFEERDWETKYYGASLPLEYALKSALQWKPEVIGLSVSIVYNLPVLKNYVRTLAALPHKPTILIGGRLANKYDLEPYTNNQGIIINNLEQAENWLDEFEEKRIKV
ncbi:cobalamin B12-binding domain-containing protein [Fictibacillus phosphorivorans]|uniref:cobalamin B12-binding domain-containing protein n=1 Tax=Fictibacillus phosphorivorans TaxID=1221500 RepID=UPI00203B0B10|nr:cobalamin B12-binding domain-containing protein [Fictibacillus phosphorivorans]MCM3719393.1 cobalamin B12-binding domain-containing protein [Fictibacillus phosphorivorans]MCM3777129.1 cobalamin B12-binding domain-containing protein [Fictibacillus phosphorivorans]